MTRTDRGCPDVAEHRGDWGAAMITAAVRTALLATATVLIVGAMIGGSSATGSTARLTPSSLKLRIASIVTVAIAKHPELRRAQGPSKRDADGQGAEPGHDGVAELHTNARDARWETDPSVRSSVMSGVLGTAPPRLSPAARP